MVGRRPRVNGDAKRAPSFMRRRTTGCHGYVDDEEAALPSFDGCVADDRPADRSQVTRDMGFKDVGHLSLAEQRRSELKRRVLDGMGGFSMEAHRKSDEELKALGQKNKKLRRFYEEQNERLDAWLEVDALVHAVADDVIDSMNPDADRDGVPERRVPLQDSAGAIEAFLPADHQEKRRRDEKHARWAINVNVVANVLMLAGKLVSLKFSPSLSLVASTADSALDLFCALIIYTTNRVVAWRLHSLKMKYPVGRRRLEPIGILVFSVIMVVSFVQILQESVTKLLPGGDREVADLPPIAIGAMAANAIIKGIIGLLCRPIKTTQVQALVQDCKTDVYFNTVSLLFPLIGIGANIWWLDPLGATLLALHVIYDWAETCLQNVSRLTGSSVSDALKKKLMFLAYRFSPVVEGFKTLTAYHAGDGVWVELDVLLDEKTPLPTAHDIAETLQYCYEGAGVDYSKLGPTGHPPN
ncbi:hypothetical protein QBC46DRAFT_367380 [Diplogelasinospora grovesii]|uniref:Cation efflux protein transmembrane domain-containing protein n=1 Tax=Diplogelasinospora grovesii TaxID=303347 RepID=A0AAN6N017_9PEZI|nr:hypothetical protein QBC46DRAFT_367380 [Diplogelasinospora grovesii]